MKNVKNAKLNYWQIDNKIKNITAVDGAFVLPSLKAWQKFPWTRKLFVRKPQEGYFVWVKKQVNFPLATCITIASPKISQDLTNLMVIEKGLKIKANVVCQSAKDYLHGSHKAKGRVILKDGASLEYEHFHQWGQKDFVSPDYEFILGKEAALNYDYKNLFPPENLELKTVIYSGENSSSNLNLIINSLNSKINLEDTVFLEKKDSRAIVRIRLVGRKNSQVKAISKIIAKAPVKGHLDCQALLVDKTAKISLSPELVCQNKDAQLTHEASIGRISEDQLTYLRMRGLTESQAINLIVSGFIL